MNKDEFIKKLFILFPTSFSKENGIEWKNAYYEVLKDNIDYNKLYDFVIKNYSGAVAPKPAFLLSNAIYINDKKEQKYCSFPTILADKQGITYEFGQQDSFLESKFNLEKKGFINIRLKFEV